MNFSLFTNPLHSTFLSLFFGEIDQNNTIISNMALKNNDPLLH